MLPDFEIITHKFENRPTIRIYPISDVHLGAQEHLEREWNLFTANFLKDQNAYLILDGDLINNGIKSSVSNVYAERMRPREQKRQMVEMLTPLRDRILCLVPGNHEWRSAREVDDEPTYDIACKLDLEHLYRENAAFVKIQMGDNRKGYGEKNPTYSLAVSHGSANGALTGGAVNKAERTAYTLDGVDVVVQGHTHKPFLTAPSKLVMDCRLNRVIERPVGVVNATSWMCYGGYAMRKGMLPQGYRPQVITLEGKRKEIDLSMKLLF